MTKQRSTKRALLSSALATFLCAAMLIGTTFAWFTDTASTAVNKIISGKLDLSLEMKENGVWVNAEGKTLNWVKAEGAEEEEILWEPGCTYNLPELRIVNNGNLALKYKVKVTGIGEGSKLKDAIDWTIAGISLDRNEEHHMAPEQIDEITISGHMKESAGNDYQNKSIKDISITIYATQDTVEYDSETNTYDEDAIYPATTAKTFSTDGVYNINTKANGFNGVVKALKAAQVEVNADLIATPGKSGDAMAVWASGTGTKITITGGYYTQEITGTGDQYDLIYADKAATIEITGGTFKVGAGDPKWTLNCYDGSGSQIIVKGGTFYKFDPSADRGQPGEVVVPDGYKVVQNGDWYTVVAE